MPNVTVGNVRDYIRGGKVVLPEGAAYVGRAVKRYGLKASPLGNPFRLGRRKENVKWFAKGLRTALAITGATAFRVDREQKAEFDRLRALAAQGDLVLVCWCETWDGTGEPPGKCHAEILLKYLEAHDAT